METLNRLLEPSQEDSRHNRRLCKFLDSITYREDIYKDPKLYQLIFKELELYYESDRMIVTKCCLQTLRSSLLLTDQITQIYEAIPLDMISSIAAQPADVQEILIYLLCQILSLLHGPSIMDAPNELFVCIIEFCLNKDNLYKCELIEKCQETLIQLIECSSYARCRFGSVGVLSCLVYLYRRSRSHTSSSQDRRLNDQVYSAMLKMFSDSNSRVRMVLSEPEIIDIVFDCLNQPMKSSRATIIAESFAAAHQFENFTEGQSLLIEKGLLRILHTYLQLYKEAVNKRNKIFKGEYNEHATETQIERSRNSLLYFQPIVFQIINLFHMISLNENLRYHLCNSELLEALISILKLNHSALHLQISARICSTLRNIFKCVSSLEALFRCDFLYQIINYASPKGLDLSQLTKSTNGNKRTTSSAGVDSAKRVLASIADILTNENSRAILRNEIGQLKNCRQSEEYGDEFYTKCILSHLYLVKYFSNLSDVKKFCNLTQGHILAFSKLNECCTSVRHLSQSSLYMLITSLYYEPDIPIIKRCLLSSPDTSYFCESDNPRVLMCIVLNQPSSDSSEESFSSCCQYGSYCAEYDWTLIMEAAKSNLTNQHSFPVKYDQIVSNSDYFNACLLGPFAKDADSVNKSTLFNLAKSIKSGACLVHLLHGCGIRCSFLTTELGNSVSLALELLELSSLVLCSSIVKQRLHASLVSIYFRRELNPSSHNVAHLLASAIKKYDELFLRLCLAHVFSASKRSSGVYSYALCKVVLSDSFQSSVSLMGVDKMNELVKNLVMEKLLSIR